MHQSYIRYIAPKDCPYTLNGNNLAALRRSALRPIARALKLDDSGTHQQMLPAIISRLATLEAPPEITDLEAMNKDAPQD
jgi:hypothetical protein